MENKGTEIYEHCIKCLIPREAYNLKIEPGFSNPDFTMPKYCQHGHWWVRSNHSPNNR